MLEKLKHMALLYDFYGQLLTERQQQVLSLYYEDNLSLGEIAEEFGVSRQAIFDLLKRAERTLTAYEEKLKLVMRWQNERDQLNEILGLLNQWELSGKKDLVDKAIIFLTAMVADEGG